MYDFFCINTIYKLNYQLSWVRVQSEIKRCPYYIMLRQFLHNKNNKILKMSQEQAKQQVNQKKDELLGKMDELGDRSEYHNLVDILFVLDTTGSMGWCISQMKKTVCKIMKKFSDKQYNIKFAIELYRDHPPQDYTYIEKHFDLRNQDATIDVIDEHIDAAGGGDMPEAVFDGLVNGLKKTSWRVSTDGKTKSKRFLFHGCDAPPHGKQYGSSSSDANWSKNGCPCGLTRHDVKKLLDEYNVDYSLIKCGSSVDVMGELFKQCFGQKFKRQMQIKHSSKRYKRGGRLERKSSICYMQQIEREQEGYIQGSQEQQCPQISRKQKKRKVNLKKEPQEKLSVISSIKDFFSSKKQKKAPSSALKGEISEDSDSDDSQDSQGNRSMASLVLSDIEDGVGSYFEDEQIKKQKKQKVAKEV